MAQLTSVGRQLVPNSGLPATIYHGLSTTTPTDTGTNVTEPSGNGYARQAVTLGTATTAGVRSNTGAVDFAASGGDWGTCTHSVFFTASSGGTAFAFDALLSSRNMIDGATMNFAIGAVEFDQD